MKFKESPLAHKYCKGKGIEFGAASHNPFNLENCINIAPGFDEEFYSSAQKGLCGEVAKIDIHGDANNFVVPDSDYDYIISSHVIEHIHDLIGAFIKWNSIIRPGGIIFIICPKRDAAAGDVGRPISSIQNFIMAHIAPEPSPVIPINQHFWVFSLQSLIELIFFCNQYYSLNWKIIEAHETDDKVGNGHCLVLKKI